jgi:curved DNA-binding protein CbpA
VEEAGWSSEPDADASSEAPSPPADEVGVQPDATAEKVRAAWRQAVLQKHPDKPGGSADEFRRVHEAWQVLKDPKARATYDQRRADQG